MWLTVIIIVLIGVGAGIVTGIMGGSGVMVVVPMLTLFLSFPVHKAIGTSLLINIVAALVTSFIYYRHHNLYVKPALWIALGSVIGAQAGSIFADMMPAVALGNLFGFMLIPMGVLLWMRGIRGTTGSVGNSSTNDALPVETRKSRLIAVGLGLLIGVMCGLFGAGGGGMIFIILIFVLHYPIHLAVGTSSLIMAITATSGTVGYAIQGNIDIFAALVATVPTMLAAGIGARVANRVGEKTLGQIIGATLIVFGIAMIVIQYIA